MLTKEKILKFNRKDIKNEFNKLRDALPIT